MDNIDYKELYETKCKELDESTRLIKRLFKKINAYKSHLDLLELEIMKLKRNRINLGDMFQKDEKFNILSSSSFISLAIKKIEKNPNLNYVLVVFDIDDFKRINDNFGHYTGDLVLKQFIELLSRSTREEIDIIGRFGGDEFVLLYEDITLENAVKRINQFIEELTSTPYSTYSYGIKKDIQVSCSAGLVNYDRNIDTTNIDITDSRLYLPHEIEKRKVYRANFIEADNELYKSKSLGKGIASYKET